MAQFEAKDSLVRGKQDKVQDLVVSKKDPSLIVDLGSDHVIQIGEEVSEVLVVMMKDDSANALVHFDQANLSIVDSAAHTAGGDKKAIKVTGLAAIDTGDQLMLKFITAK